MSHSGKKLNVAIYQPVIPKYRIPLFTMLHFHSGYNIKVFASMRCPGYQVTAEKDFQFRFNPVQAYGFGRGIFWQSRLRIPNCFKNGDVIVLSGMPKFLNLYPLIMAAKVRRIGIVWWGHGYSVGSRGWSVAIRQRIMRLVDVILLYTEKEVVKYQQAGFSSDRLFATNNTIDTSVIQSAKNDWTPQKITNFKKSNGILNTKNLLFCSRLEQKAELNIALTALSKLLTKDPKYRLFVVGDGKEKNRLVRKAQKLNIDYAVHWLGPIYNEFELAPWFLSSLLFVYPGSIGLSLLHAFAYHLPVITHDLDRLHGPEFAALKNDVNGLVFKHGDPSDLASKIRSLSINNTKRVCMQKNAQATMHGEFSFESMVKRFIEALNAASLISSTGGVLKSTSNG
jgi:glycosyltransferase involved in cell wall biosynthesis